MQVGPLLRSVVVAAPLSAIAAGAQTLPLPGDAPNLRPSLPVEAYLDWGLGVVGNEVLTVGEVSREQLNPMSPWQRAFVRVRTLGPCRTRSSGTSP